ncbi:MAG: hypothetical protein R3263_11900 [Myxococcota bacterium]|nr:hypothetical protein [Myxococcota bacterium]
MSTALFDRLADRLEQRTGFTRLEARGTLRLALREAGLEPEKLTRDYARAVVDRMLPRELETRGVPDAARLCASIAAEIADMDDGVADAHRPETLFERLQRG